MSAGLNIGRRTVKQSLNKRLLKVYRENGVEWQVWNPVSLSIMLEIIRDTKDGLPAKAVLLRSKPDLDKLLNIFNNVPDALTVFAQEWFERD